MARSTVKIILGFMFVLLMLSYSGSLVLTNMLQRTITVNTKTTVHEQGKPTMIRVRLYRPLRKMEVSLNAQIGSGAPLVITKKQADAKGDLNFEVSPDQNTVYWASYREPIFNKVVKSDDVEIYLRPKIDLAVPESAFIKGTYSLSLSVQPSKYLGQASIQELENGIWKDVGFSKADRESRLTYAFKASKLGATKFRGTIKESAANLQNNTEPVEVAVEEPFIGIAYSDYTLKTSWQGDYYKNRVQIVEDVVSEHFSRAASRRINDKQLENINELNKFKIVLLPATTSTSKAQRIALREYVRGGGNIVSLFGVGRNDHDGTPLILKHQFSASWDLSRFWEWEELSDVYQLKFNDDPLMHAQYRIKGLASGHPIIENTKKTTGLTKITLLGKRASYNELAWSMKGNRNATPILFYDTLSNGYPEDDASHKVPAAWISEFYKGKAAYFTFILPDFMNKKDKENSRIASQLLLNTVEWLTGEPTKSIVKKRPKIKADVWLQGRHGDYAIRIKQTVANKGTLQLRGKYFIKVYNGKKLVFSDTTKEKVPLGPRTSWPYDSWKVPVSGKKTRLLKIRAGFTYHDIEQPNQLSKASVEHLVEYNNGSLKLLKD